MRKVLKLATGLLAVLAASVLLSRALPSLVDPSAEAARGAQLLQAITMLRQRARLRTWPGTHLLAANEALAFYRPYGAPDTPIFSMVEVQFKAALPYTGDVLRALGAPTWFRRNAPAQAPGATLYYPTLQLAVHVVGQPPLVPTSEVVSITFSEAIRPNNPFWRVCQAWVGLADR